jgi:hypothetical protein
VLAMPFVPRQNRKLQPKGLPPLCTAKDPKSLASGEMSGERKNHASADFDSVA